MTYATVRERAFQEIQKHPENVEAISHNLSVALMMLDTPATTWMATMDELNRRWEYAVSSRSTLEERGTTDA